MSDYIVNFDFYFWGVLNKNKYCENKLSKRNNLQLGLGAGQHSKKFNSKRKEKKQEKTKQKKKRKK